MSNRNRHIAVIGAGPMGLMAAIELCRRGHRVDVFERDDRIGGMSASFDLDGQTVERYYHFICKPDRPLLALLDELGVASSLRWVDTRMGFYCNGRMYPWGDPLALLRFDQIGLLTRLRYGLMALRAKSVRDWRPYDRLSAVDWLKSWLGEHGYEVLWRRLFELKFQNHGERLSAAWLGTRIQRIARSRRSLFQESLGHLHGGSKTLLDAMEREIVRHGGRIHLRAGVERILDDGQGNLTGMRIDGTEHTCETVLSTIPIQYVARLAPGLPAEFRAGIDMIENIAVVCVVIKLNHRLTDKFWLNISDPEIDIPGLIEYSNLNPCDGSHIVYAPFYLPKTHPRYARPDSEFVDETLAAMKRVAPHFSPDQILARHCHRYEFAQTVCPPGFASMLPPMRTPLNGLFMADTSYYYPEDRSISESIRVGRELTNVALLHSKVAS